MRTLEGAVAIVGSAPSWTLALEERETTEIWATGLMFRHLPRITRWFEMHADPSLRVDAPPTNAHDYKAWLSSFQGIIYVLEQDASIPCAIPYPITGRPYLTNTIAYMLALAVYRGYASIKLYGVDMAVNEEYAKDRQCVLYWLGVAEGQGIAVVLPPGCALIAGNEHVPEREYLAKGNTL